MSYYRAALAAAANSNITKAKCLVECSLAINEDAPSAARLLELLRSRTDIDPQTLTGLREHTTNKEYRKALKLCKATSSKAYVARGLLYALLGRKRLARKEFIQSMIIDSGNEIARQALLYLSSR